jgi:ferredoxin-nitrate reductase
MKTTELLAVASPGGRDSINDIHGQRTPYQGLWPQRQDALVAEEPERWVRSACVMCSTGCGIELGVRNNRIVAIRGDVQDQVNKGRLGPKGLHAWVANHSADRLTRPLVRKNGELVGTTWEEAMDLIVNRARHILKVHGPSAMGFYTSGQLFLEDYYTLAKVVLAGIGTPHLDGNTRLCTATAGEALQESFGADGQPGCYEDLDHADTLFLVGHNMAETQTVLWMRVLDRLAGAAPPAMVVMDPRLTTTTRKATVHLAPKPGTNMAVLNALLHLVIKNGWIDAEYISSHTTGFAALEKTVRPWSAQRAHGVTGIPTARLEEAAELLGTAKRLVSTCLQGVYQSHQATASACQVNNLHLIRGMLGRPGCTVFQMNGQPTAQNTRETGCTATLPGFRNWANEVHAQELARLWNVAPEKLPHHGPLTHVMQMMRYVETGSLKMLWVTATNPAVTLPQLDRIRELLKKDELFLVVNDCFPTETTRLASVVLPAAIWGEKTGTFTNADRTVHLSQQAVTPPGQARTDMAIFQDFAARMDFKDKDGQPLIQHCTPEEAFNEWRAVSRGRPCDYSGMSYARLAGTTLHWPCNEQHPDGAERLYTDGQFPTAAAYTENYGHDLLTGAHTEEAEYKAQDPVHRAIIKPADHEEPAEQPDSEYPFLFTTGRLVHQFHTRTKTGRAKTLNAAAPEAFIQLSSADAEGAGIKEGDLVRVTSRRGSVEAPARIGDIEPGTVFMPMHYGYWDQPTHRTAANEITQTLWDPVSKQPQFKYAAVKVERIAEYTTAQPVDERKSDTVPARKEAQQLPLVHYIAMLRSAHAALADSFQRVAKEHADEPDLASMLTKLAAWSTKAVEELRPALIEYGAPRTDEAQRLLRATETDRKGGLGLVRHLHGLLLQLHEVELCATVVLQTAKARRDAHLVAHAEDALTIAERQRAFLQTRLKATSPQSMLHPS